MAAPDLTAVIRGIRRSVSRRPNVSAAYVFGSVATGRARRDSDLDVAVLLDPRMRRGDALTSRLQLIADLGAALGRSDVDVVILNDAAPLLAHRVLSQGRLVFERSATTRVRFQVRTAARYLDFVPVLETHIRALKQHARERRRRG